MPAFDGFWLIQELRGAGLETPAIAVSADPQARNRELLAGFIGFMAKPMEPWELADRISCPDRTGRARSAVRGRMCPATLALGRHWFIEARSFDR